MKQSNFEKIIMPRPAYGFRYAAVTYRIRFHFHLTSREFPAIRVQPIAAARGRRQTDGRTDRHCASFHNVPPYGGRGIII